MGQATVNLNLSKSAYIREDNPNMHYGTAYNQNYLLSGTSSTEKYLLLGFQSMPSNLKRKKLLGVQLSSYLRMGILNLRAYCLYGGFDASSVTWSTRPSQQSGYSYVAEFESVLADRGQWQTMTAPSSVTIDSTGANPYNAIINGIALGGNTGYNASDDTKNWYGQIGLGNSTPMYITIAYDPDVTITSTISPLSYPTGSSVSSAASQRFSWAFIKDTSGRCSDETWTQASAKIFWKTSGESSYHQVSVSGSTMEYTFPANTFPAGETIEWYLQGTDTDGTTTTTGTRSFTTTGPVLTMESYPSGNSVDSRNALGFSWSIVESGTSTSLTQVSATLYWRVSGATNYNEINITGNTKSVSVPAYTFPSNSTIEWYLFATVQNNITVQSSSTSFKTQAFSLAVTNAPSGSNVDSRAQQTWTWTLSNSFGDATQSSAILYWRVDGAPSYTQVNVSGNTKTVTIPANTFPENTTIQWYLKSTAADGTVFTTNATTFRTQSVVLTITASPTGSSVDSRVSQTWTWTVSNSSGAVTQASAILYWRVSGGSNYTQVPISGDTKTVSVSGYTFPQDTTIQWYIRSTLTTGTVLESSPTTFKTQAFSISITSAPSGSGIDPTAAIVFSWKLANSGGDVPQTSAKFYWRSSSTGSYTQVNVSGSTKNVSIPGNTFPTGKTIQWYVSATAQGGVVLETSVYSFSTVSTRITPDTYPSGNSVYTAQAIRFTWHFSSSIGDVTQASATLYWRTSTSDPYTQISVTGNTQELTVPANTFPTGKTVQWYLEGTDIGGSTSTSSTYSFTTVTTQITPQSSPTSGYMDPRNAIVFQWYFASSGGPVPQGSATFYWREAGASSWTSVAASGSTAKVTIAANTFPVATTIEWYVAGTDIGGTSSTSSVYSFSTTASTAYAYPTSPIGVTVDQGRPITLKWTLVNADGTQPSKVTLQWKTPTDVNWTTIRSASPAFTEWEVAAEFFPVGDIEWRVIATNRDNVDGPAGTATFITISAPQPPEGLSATSVPRTTVSWQSAGQEGYEIFIDGVSVARAYGTENVWQADFVLDDGDHVIGVRIQGAYGMWSEASFTSIAVENVVPEGWEDFAISGEFGVDADLTATGADELTSPTIHWFRDGKAIGICEGMRSYQDRYVLGQHDYYAEIWNSAGYYVRSDTVQGVMKSCITRIALFSGGPWVDLRLSERSNSEQDFTYNRVASLQHVLGAVYPVLELSAFEDITGSYDCAFTDVESAARFESFRGKHVIMKSRGGNVVIGALLDLQKKYGEFFISYTFTVQAIDWEDFRHVSQNT